MNLIELFEQEYRGKVDTLCQRLDEARADFVTDEDRDEHEDMDTVEIGQELYSKEGLETLSSDLIKELKPDATDEEKLEFAEYINTEDWIFDL